MGMNSKVNAYDPYMLVLGGHFAELTEMFEELLDLISVVWGFAVADEDEKWCKFVWGGYSIITTVPALGSRYLIHLHLLIRDSN